MSTPRAGGWSPFEFTLTPDAKHVFETAVAGLLGARYTPLAFASQPVDGILYSFLCETEAASWLADTFVAKIRIFQPPEDRDHPVIVSIETVSP